MRRDGSTIRTIDDAIQTLFKHGRIQIPISFSGIAKLKGAQREVLIVDPSANHVDIQRELFSKIRNRLQLEHPNQYTTDVRTMTITLNEAKPYDIT